MPTYRFKLRNETNWPLDSFPVVTSPPPPHRELNPGARVEPGNTGPLDWEEGGFNPLYGNGRYNLDGDKPNVLMLQFDLESSPPVTLVRLFHYKVAPDQQNNDPALQPILLLEELVELQAGKWLIRVHPQDLVTLTFVQP